MLKRLWENLQLALRPAWQSPEVGALYQAVATASRQPVLYQQGGVPDSLDGRFDLLSLHLVLLLRRLRGQGRKAEAMRQYLFDLLAADMDRSLREMGVGDTGISRRIKAMGQAFYGRLAAYDAALLLPDIQQCSAMMTALDKNLYGTIPTDAEKLGWMAEYVLRIKDSLDRQPVELILMGRVTLAG